MRTLDVKDLVHVIGGCGKHCQMQMAAAAVAAPPSAPPAAAAAPSGGPQVSVSIQQTGYGAGASTQQVYS